MIYALLNRNTRIEDRERIVRAIQEQRAGDLQWYVNNGIITHIMDIQSNVFFYCIYCRDQLYASRRNPPLGQRAVHRWYFMHRTNNQCINHHNNVGNGTYLNPPRHGCYIQLGCLATHHYTSCELRKDSQNNYCHHAFTTICPP